MEMKHVSFKTKGVCAAEISFDLIDGYVHNVVFDGGCAGNTQGVAMLAEGMPAQMIAERLKGIQCNGGTSCPNEFAKAIMECLLEN